MNLIHYVRQRFHPLFFLRKIAAGRGLLKFLDRPVWLQIPGISFPVRGRQITHRFSYAVDGFQEPGMVAFMQACLQLIPVQEFWDVGANIGYYSWLVRSIKPDTRIVMFEPYRPNQELIRRTLAQLRQSPSGDDSVTVIESAVSDRNGSALMNADTISGTTSSLEPGETFEQRHWKTKPTPVQTTLVTLDLQHHNRGEGPVDMIKIDVEGHEAAALRGARFLISVEQPIVLIECFHPGHSCTAVLEKAGYRIIDLDRLSTDPDATSTNFGCIPPRFQDLLPQLMQLSLKV